MLPQDQEEQGQSIQQKHLWRMRWYLIGILSTWTAVSITGPIVAFCLTRNTICFSFFTTLAPPVYLWYRLIKYLLLMSENDFRLEMEKLQLRKDTLSMLKVQREILQQDKHSPSSRNREST